MSYTGVVYWAGRAPPPNNGTSNMAAANFVVITKDVREPASCYYATAPSEM